MIIFWSVVLLPLAAFAVVMALTELRRDGLSHNTLEIDGRTFGRLTVLRRSHRRSDSRGHALWDCRCACGNEKMVRAKTLVSGETQSCGCLQRERMREYNARRRSYE